MATVKKNNKKKIVVPICLVLVVAIILVAISAKNYAAYGQFRLKTDGEEVTLSTISTQNIIESVNATGDVTAGVTKEYKVPAVATVKEVFVKVGDQVKKGDKLATFNTDNLNSQIQSLNTNYNESKAAYESAAASQASAKKKLSAVNSKISKLEKQVAKLEKQQAKESKTTTRKKTTTKRHTTTTTKPTTTKRPTTTTTTTATTTTTTTAATPGSMAESLAEIAKSLSQLTNDIETMTKLLEVISKTISDALASGDYSPDSIAQKCGDAVAKAIKEGIIDETKLIIDSGIAVDMVEAAVASIDWASVAKEITSTTAVQLTASQIQLAALYAEREIFTASADSTIVNAQKKLMNTSKNALDTLKEAEKDLEDGWTASVDGTITECELVEGGQTTAFKTGIKLENMDQMVATISLGEYDVHKVKVGMKATIKTAYGSYTGEVATIAPTATGGSEGSVLDSVGSMAGISGLSSLTSSGAGVECTVTIDNPDENIIIGFDADVKIVTGTYTNVPAVPIESIVLAKDGTYVYLYDEEKGTVTKTAITTGAISDSAYEIKSGINVGDKIVATPSSDYKEDTFKVIIPKNNTKSTSKK